MKSRRDFLGKLVASGAALQLIRPFGNSFTMALSGAAGGPQSPAGNLSGGALYRSPKTYFGVCYYPEAWDESRWPTDVKMMREAGFNIVRMAEFAWARIEPVEGQLDFNWLDKIVDLLSQNGIRTLMGTPTSQPPPWLYLKLPDLLPVNPQGIRYNFGGRYLYCFNHPEFGEYTRKIVSAIAKRYANHPAVVGWHLDNEFGHVTRECYCKEYCEPAFHKWLEARYGSLDKLNAAWGTSFWSQIYSDWSQIPLPRMTQQQHNPALVLNYRRFWSDSVVRYQKLQIDVLSGLAPRQFTTHNLWGKPDYFAMARDLNVAGMNFYPADGWGRLEDNGLELDTFRGLKDGNYWVVEQRGGRPGSHNETLESAPGLLRLWAYQSYAHGADAVLFFRWRTAARGGEEYWFGLLGQDGRPNRRYREIAGMGKELDRLVRLIEGTTTTAPVAFYVDYESEWAKTAPDVRAFDEQRADYYRAFKRLGVNIDVTGRGRDLSRYKIVFAPMLYMVNGEIVEQLTRFVRAGGTLILTFRSGVKEWDNSVTMEPLPGRLRGLAGIEIEEYEPLLKTDPELNEGEMPLTGVAAPFTARASTGTIWADILEPKSAQALAKYGKKFYAGKAAATVNRVGDGRVIYVGTHLSHDFANVLAAWTLAHHQIAPPFPVPDQVDVASREKGGKKIIFMMNFSNSAQTITLRRTCRNVLAERDVSGSVLIPARDLVILAQG
jgi:beta-galactosidase